MKKIIAESLGKEIEAMTRSLEALHEILDLAELKGFNCEELARGQALVTEGIASLAVAKMRLARERAGKMGVSENSVRDLVEGATGTLNLIALEWIGESPLPGERVLNFRVLRKEGNEYSLAAKLKKERTFVMVGTMEEIEETFKIPGHA